MLGVTVLGVTIHDSASGACWRRRPASLALRLPPTARFPRVREVVAPAPVLTAVRDARDGLVPLAQRLAKRRCGGIRRLKQRGPLRNEIKASRVLQLVEDVGSADGVLPSFDDVLGQGKVQKRQAARTGARRTVMAGEEGAGQEEEQEEEAPQGRVGPVGRTIDRERLSCGWLGV